MATPLTDSINAITQYANETTGKQDTTLSDAVGSLVEGYGGSELLQTLTFSHSIGRQEIIPDSSWADYDCLLFVPYLNISENSNWLYLKITGTKGSIYQYDANGSVGNRDIWNIASIIKGKNGNNYQFRFIFLGSGRGSTLTLKNATDINSETFADLIYEYGTYRNSDENGFLDGTVKIYGIKFT